jgi:hypothetical protein
MMDKLVISLPSTLDSDLCLTFPPCVSCLLGMVETMGGRDFVELKFKHGDDV